MWWVVKTQLPETSGSVEKHAKDQSKRQSQETLVFRGYRNSARRFVSFADECICYASIEDGRTSKFILVECMMVYTSCTAGLDRVDDRKMREYIYKRECTSIWLGGGPSLVGHHILTILFLWFGPTPLSNIDRTDTSCILVRQASSSASSTYQYLLVHYGWYGLVDRKHAVNEWFCVPFYEDFERVECSKRCGLLRGKVSHEAWLAYGFGASDLFPTHSRSVISSTSTHIEDITFISIIINIIPEIIVSIIIQSYLIAWSMLAHHSLIL